LARVCCSIVADNPGDCTGLDGCVKERPVPRTTLPTQQGPTGLELISSTVSLILTVGALFVAIVFAGATYSSFVHELYPAIFSSESLLWKFSIVLYFTSWYGGVRLDHAREAKIYRMPLPEVKVDPTSAALAFMIFVLFGFMYLVEDIQTANASGKEAESLLYYLGSLILADHKTAAVAWLSKHGTLIIIGLINFLWFFNIFLWRWFVEYFIKPLSKRSIEHYRHERPNPNYFGVLKVDVLNHYLDGEWQWLRFKWGTAFILVIDLVQILILYDFLPKPEVTAALFVAFVVTFESWVWIKRLQVGFQISYLDEISRKYDLRLR
jgi:hypothetical protein